MTKTQQTTQTIVSTYKILLILIVFTYLKLLTLDIMQRQKKAKLFENIFAVRMPHDFYSNVKSDVNKQKKKTNFYLSNFKIATF